MCQPLRYQFKRILVGLCTQQLQISEVHSSALRLLYLKVGVWEANLLLKTIHPNNLFQPAKGQHELAKGGPLLYPTTKQPSQIPLSNSQHNLPLPGQPTQLPQGSVKRLEHYLINHCWHSPLPSPSKLSKLSCSLSNAQTLFKDFPDGLRNGVEASRHM